MRLTALICALGAATVVAAQESKIVAGANYLVSRDGDVPHAEMHIAVNPRDPQNLLATSITATRPEGGWACRTYASLDGGATWAWRDFPEQVRYGGLDPQVAFTPTGTALFLALSTYSVHDDDGKPRGGLDIYRSSDGGLTWGRTEQFCCSHDHPQIAVDQSSGRFGGRVYIGTLYDYPFYRIGMFRSDDDGRTFKGPVEVTNGGGTLGLNVMSIPILSDGTLVVTMVDFQFLPGQRTEGTTVDIGLWVATSTDGGVTFSKRQRVNSITVDLGRNDLLPVPHSAADPSGRFPNHVYMVWPDNRFGAARLLYSRSTDRGATWSAPVKLAPDVPEMARQYQPTIAVNRDGVLGITWFDTRHVTDGSEFHMYFTASTDGGRSFLPAERVTNAPSIPGGRGNLKPLPSVYKIAGSGSLSLTSVANRWPTGGDYLGMTADRRGVFYPVWSDARSGTYQVYTAPIRVEVPLTAEEKKRIEMRSVWEGAEQKGPDPAKRVELDLLDEVDLVFDEVVMNDEVLEIPIRLRNRTTVPFYAPLRMEVLGFGGPESSPRPEVTPELLNGKGFSFDEALGDDRTLLPGMISGPVTIRLRVPNLRRIPSMRFRLIGMADPPIGARQ